CCSWSGPCCRCRWRCSAPRRSWASSASPGGWPARACEAAGGRVVSDVDLDLTLAAGDAGDHLAVLLVVHEELVHVLDLSGDQRHHAGAAHPAFAGVVHRDAGVEQSLEEGLALLDLDRDPRLQALGGEGLSEQRHPRSFCVDRAERRAVPWKDQCSTTVTVEGGDSR